MVHQTGTGQHSSQCTWLLQEERRILQTSCLAELQHALLCVDEAGVHDVRLRAGAPAGIHVAEDGCSVHLVVSSVNASVVPGDMIVAVDGEPVCGYLSAVLQRKRGPVGATLSVMRGTAAAKVCAESVRTGMRSPGPLRVH